MLKGHTKIQLFDEKSGKMTDEIEDDNIITNASKTIISEMVRDWINAYDGAARAFPKGNVCENGSNTYLSRFMSMFFGGVFVFSDSIEENVKHIYPSSAEMFTSIGHAGQNSNSSSDTSAGNFNSSESLMDNKNKEYRFVWDFPTSACNGDIASICLTSAHAGQAGFFKEGAYNSDNFGINYIPIYPFAPHTKRLDINAGSDIFVDEDFDKIGVATTMGAYVGESYDISESISGYTMISQLYTRGYYWRVYYKVSNNVYDFRCFDYDRKTYHDYSVNMSGFISALRAMYSGWTNLFAYACYIYLDDKNMVLYAGRAQDSFPNVHLGKIDLKTGTYKTNTITMPSDWSGSYLKSQLCINFNNVFDDIGVVCEYWYVKNIQKNGTSTMSILDDNLNIKKNYCMYNFVPYSSSFNISTNLRDARGYKSIANNALYDMYYLATINNLPSVLTKTKDKTMKIIYTLKEEGD